RRDRLRRARRGPLRLGPCTADAPGAGGRAARRHLAADHRRLRDRDELTRGAPSRPRVPLTSHAALVASSSHPGRNGGGFLSGIAADPCGVPRFVPRCADGPGTPTGRPRTTAGPKTAPSPKLLFFPCLSSSPVAPPGA